MCLNFAIVETCCKKPQVLFRRLASETIGKPFYRRPLCTGTCLSESGTSKHMTNPWLDDDNPHCFPFESHHITIISSSNDGQSVNPPTSRIQISFSLPKLPFISTLNISPIKTGWWVGTFFIFPYIRNNHPN
jgi:hypothetical protein